MCYRAELGGRQVDLARLGDESWALGRRRGSRAWKQRKYQHGCGVGRRGIYFWWVVIFFGVLLKMEKVIFVSTHGASSPPHRQTPKLSRKGKPQEGWVGAKAGAAMATKE